MNQLFYHTSFSQEAHDALQNKNFKSAESAIYPNGDGSFFLVMNVEDQRFWITNNVGLADQNQLANAHYEQNILPITLNEIQKWES